MAVGPAVAGAGGVLGAEGCFSMTRDGWVVTARSLPFTFVPVIQTRIVLLMSATFGVYVAAVAPGIWTQLARSPGALQRRHEYVNVGAGVPSHVPRVSDSGWSMTGCVAPVI